MKSQKEKMLGGELYDPFDSQLWAVGIPTMQDRAHQALQLLALAPIAETTGDPNSYGFRKARSVAEWTPGQAYRLGSQNPQDNTIWMTTTNRVGLLPGDSVSPGPRPPSPSR